MEKTPLELEREKRYKEFDKDKYIFVVQNHESMGIMLETEFENIEDVLHKIKLDLMTMAHYGRADGEKVFIKIFLKRK